MASEILVDGLEWVHGSTQPLAGTSSTELIGWEEYAVQDRERFARELEGMGLPEPIVSQGLQIRDQAASAINESIKKFWDAYYARTNRSYLEPPELLEEVRLVSNSATRQAWQRLRDWWAGRDTEVQSREDVELRLPLFLLAAPANKGCEAEVTTQADSNRNLGWALVIGGTGLGAEAKVTVRVIGNSPAQAFADLHLIVSKVLISARRA